ncbi:MAG: multiheme c-type cytochrome [Campylobacterota bacterium]|nr:multiheme c-type cytochrome [Campylobacterota bacterium]
MLHVTLVLSFFTLLFSETGFEPNLTCKACHPKIYKEYEHSQHANSNIYHDKIHGAIFAKHPHKKMQKYQCGKCHTPAADNLNALMEAENGVLPDPKNASQNEGVSCSLCHRIEDYSQSKLSNTNVISKEKELFFDRYDEMNIPFHNTKKSKESFGNGQVCMGCHQHSRNRALLAVCEIDEQDPEAEQNCVSCHMPQVEGLPSVMSLASTHAFHGFPGIHGKTELLEKYIGLELIQKTQNFNIAIDHNVTHHSSIHPLRVGLLRVSINRGGEQIQLEDKTFKRVLGKEGKPKPPWIADSILIDSRLKPESRTEIHYDFKLLQGDLVDVAFGHRLVSKKAAKKFGMDADASKFRILKEQRFSVKSF